MRNATPLDEAAIEWSAPEHERVGRPLVVFLHGFRGHESDWSAWFPALPAGTVGASLRAPVSVRERWAWADVPTRGRSTSRMTTALSAAARGVSEWTDRQQARDVALVGWSQGGALAVHLLRQRPRRYVCAAVVAGFVADLRPHAGVRATRPPVWYGTGGQDDVITSAMTARSRRWLAEHTSATCVELPNENHMLSPTLVDAALEFTRSALEARRA